MRRFLVLVVMLVALLPAAAQAHEGSHPELVHIEAGTEHRGDVSTVDELILVDGAVHGDVTSISGQIIVRGVVTGDVVSWGGDITLERGAQVSGSVMTLAGGVHRDDTAQVAGQQFNGNLKGAGFASLIPGTSTPEPSLAAKLSLALTLFVLGVAIAALLGHLWSRVTESAAAVVEHFLPRTLLLGLLTSALTAIVLAILVLALMLTLVGLIAVPVLLLVVHLPFLVGLAAVGRALEHWLQVKTAYGIAGTAILLLPAVLFSLWQPLLGFGAFYLVSAAGVGALLLLRSTAIRFHRA